MTPREILINAARFYCEKHYAEWTKAYDDLIQAKRHQIKIADSWSYSPEALNIFPRYVLLGAIRAELETLDVHASASEIQTRDELEVLGDTVPIHVGPKSQSTEEERAVEGERELFCDFVRKVRLEHCDAVPLQPYRHTLPRDEAAMLRHRVEETWGSWSGGRAEYPQSKPIAVLHVDVMGHNSYERLRTVLARLGGKRIYELKEGGLCREIECSNATFYYDGEESSWTDSSLSWFVNASREASILFGGEKLIAAMRAELPEFERYIYKGYDSSQY